MAPAATGNWRVMFSAAGPYRGHRATLATLCGVFLAAGIAFCAIGPALPDLARQTHRSLDEVGRLFIAVFGGTLGALLLGGPASDRFGRKVVLLSGLVFCALGIAGLALSVRMLWLLTAAGVFGVGYGLATLATNVLASEMVPARRASTVNLVNLFFALGAIAAPLVAGVSIGRFASARPALWTAVVLLVISGAAAACIRSGHAAARADAAPPANLNRAMAFILALGGLLALYVGSEASFGAWTPTYLQRSTPLTAAGATMSTALFYTALCVGRLIGTVVGARVSAERLLVGSLAGSVAGGVLLVAGHGSVAASLLALFVLGVGFGPIYPTGVALVTARFPRAAGAATSRIGLVVSIGGMLLPWLQGIALTQWGTFAAAVVALAVLAAMFAMWAVVRRVDRAASWTAIRSP
jgi:FHS family Na+ dependent glucose MFS transporter 1